MKESLNGVENCPAGQGPPVTIISDTVSVVRTYWLDVGLCNRVQTDLYLYLYLYLELSLLITLPTFSSSCFFLFVDQALSHSCTNPSVPLLVSSNKHPGWASSIFKFNHQAISYSAILALPPADFSLRT